MDSGPTVVVSHCCCDRLRIREFCLLTSIRKLGASRNGESVAFAVTLTDARLAAAAKSHQW